MTLGPNGIYLVDGQTYQISASINFVSGNTTSNTLTINVKDNIAVIATFQYIRTSSVITTATSLTIGKTFLYTATASSGLLTLYIPLGGATLITSLNERFLSVLRLA